MIRIRQIGLYENRYLQMHMQLGSNLYVRVITLSVNQCQARNAAEHNLSYIKYHYLLMKLVYEVKQFIALVIILHYDNEMRVLIRHCFDIYLKL